MNTLNQDFKSLMSTYQELLALCVKLLAADADQAERDKLRVELEKLIQK